MPSIERPEPPYLQVVRHIREQILSGQLPEGSAVPSARQITRDWDVAMATAMKAITTLRAEGLIRSLPGKGTFVESKQHRSAHDRSAAVLRTGRIYPPGHYARILSAELVAAPEHVADALHLAPSSPVIRRQRVTYDTNNVPLSTSVSWFDGGLAGQAPLLLQTERIVQGTARYIEEQTGRTRGPLEQDTTYLEAEEASEEEATALGITAGAPILRGHNFYRDVDGEVIEYGDSAALKGLKVRIGPDSDNSGNGNE